MVVPCLIYLFRNSHDLHNLKIFIVIIHHVRSFVLFYFKNLPYFVFILFCYKSVMLCFSFVFCHIVLVYLYIVLGISVSYL